MPASTASTRPLTESALYIILATLASTLVASPMLVGWFTGELTGLLVPVAQLTPFIVALILFTLWRPGRITDVFALRWGRSWWALAVGFVTLIAISLIQLGFGLVLGSQIRPAEPILMAAVAVLPFLLIQSAFAVGEEWGWRGWLVTRTQHLSMLRICLVSAVAWTVWHLPALPLILQDASIDVGIAYLASIFSWAPVLVVLRILSGSVWPAVFLHGGLNSVRVFFLQSVADSGGINWAVEALGWVLWIGAAIVLWNVGKHKAGPRRISDPLQRGLVG